MDKIAVLDFGGQYAHLIANRVRRLNVFSEIFEGDTPAEKLREFKGIILSGGPQSVYDEDSLKCDPGILELGVPLLGICYGHQALAYVQGAKVEPADFREYGLAEMKITKAKGLFDGLNPTEIVWMSHGDSVKELPPGYEVIGESPGENAAIANFEKNFYGVQFHLEVTHTAAGMKMLNNFLNLCNVKREWKIDDFIAAEMELVRKKVGKKKVFMMVSGGVDSTVAFALLEKALGPDRVFGLFVDTGFLRLNERTEVEEALKSLGFNNLHVRDASKRYFEALQDRYDPEAKRKIIGDLFVKAQAEIVEELKLNPEEWLLGQGTIYPDTIETGGTKYAAKIKTHHNRVEQIEKLMKEGKVIEPLAQLYKDEVREVGMKLGLPEKLVWRHPFPGPGLAVRCLCIQEAVPVEHQSTLEKNINEEVAKFGLQGKVLPIQSVGVQGDFRTYRHPLVLMGASDFKTLGKLATKLINQFQEINRVIWLQHPNKIESVKVQNSYLTRERIKLLQQADAKVNEFMEKHSLSRQIWQFPTVLIPVSINRENGEAIVLRPVCSEEAMTANFYEMDLKLLKNLTEEIMTVPGITAVFYDVTNKPPGTIEWE
ncbi:MAG: glutamine-hydrolyzing GMP synthase [Candidatus Gracilibacteria bacterium]|jgi:GMP synthase (glutamine-hydrolysing)